jgi:tetratricopeptide (TPR) repeat protein
VRKTISLLLISIFFVVTTRAQTFDFNANCQRAYQAIFKLKIDEGLQLIEKEKKENPKNQMVYFIENYADFLKLYINDNNALYDQLLPKFSARIDKLKDASKNSPYYLYTQADIHLQSALCKIKFGDNLSAVFEVKKAFTLLQENQQKYPNFKPNIKSLGLLHTIFGAVPDNYKFGAKLLGLKGSIDQGLKELNNVIQDSTFQFKEEAIIEYTLLLLHLQKNKTAAWNMISKAEIPLQDNLLNHFIAATVASHTGKNDEVISILSKKPTDKSFYAFPLLDFILAKAKLNKLDGDADVYIKKFLAANKGRSYQKEAYQKLAWFYLAHDNASLYKKYMQQVLALKDAPTDEDKAAQKEANQNYVPNAGLLKARLLCDGAYYAKALEIMNSIQPNKLTRSRDQVEYYYRKARIFDEQNNDTEAIKYYQQTIEKGNSYDYYFAANAALKLGNIFELQKKKTNAIQYYKKAIDLDKDEYTNSINAEAKAGLNRLGN